MKQAILLTAYKDISFIQDIISVFNDDYSFYIHLDNKQNYNKADVKALEGNRRVKYISQKYKIHWASVKHLEAILDLAREACKDESIEYIHSITGQDFPVKSPEQISEYLTQNKGIEFIGAAKLPCSHWVGGGINRIEYYAPYEYLNAKGKGSYLIQTMRTLQKMLGFKRRLPAEFPELYGGLVYFTLTREAVKYCLDYLDTKPHLFNRFKYTFSPEEILIQSILFNSPFKDRICNDNLRFMIWSMRDGQSPAILDERDYEKIKLSNAIFARKFDSKISSGLIEKLQRSWSI